ncbi:TSC22 domain family protein 1-like isoform X1 [Scleropages formosus]|uniref:TSC22 domain family protein 1-like isoform X1 n=1 Tax=Scleropages formosus TaxID=113540 RepID=UPI0010FAB424|nr:TSC22 domain family protein 1-like isoform X1 [Scleropages formosus]
MHQPESAGESTGGRKMAQAAVVPRRGSGPPGGGVASASLAANVVPAEDYQSALLIQPPLPAVSSSPGPQHPPQSLNLLSQSQLQPQPLLSVGAQMKKKSGFQITSVTPAQVSVSTNNSIAEDTESYDDLDESHTEDLSSSEILDVSLSRATDMGAPERSSSEETLNYLHEVETPGAVSPNQPHLSGKPPQHTSLPPALQQSAMVNGAVHHHPGPPQQHHAGHQPPIHAAQSAVTLPPVSASGGTSAWVPEVGAMSAALASTAGSAPGVPAQVLPAAVGAVLDVAAVGAANVVAPPLAGVTPGAVTGVLSVAAGAPISGISSLVSNVSSMNRMSSVNTVVPSIAGTASSSTGAPGQKSGGAGLTRTGVQGANLMQKQSAGATASIAVTAGITDPAVTGSAGGSQAVAANTGQPVPSVPHGQPQQPAQAPAPAAGPAGSRFRVVKLDSSSEPFRKGRWTCTEYYDKEIPSMATTAPVSDSVPSERESSAAAIASMQSRYPESVGSGEILGPSTVPSFQQQPQLQDYSAPPGIQASHPVVTQSVPQPQVATPHVTPQDMVHSLLKANAGPSVSSNLATARPQASLNPVILPTAVVSTSQVAPPQQVPHTQTAPLAPVQVLPVGVQPQMTYPSTQLPAAPVQSVPPHALPVAQGSSLPPDFTQHPPIIQTAVQSVVPGTVQPLPPMTGSMPSVAVPGSAAGSLSAPVSQPLPQGLLQQHAPSASVPQSSQGVIPPAVLPGGVAVPPQPLLKAQPQPGDPLVPAASQPPPPIIASGQVAPLVPPSIPADPQPTLLQRSPQLQSSAGAGLAQQHTSAQYTTLPSVTATHLEDARRLLFQHQSLLSLPKMGGGDGASETGTPLAADGVGVANALTASAGLFPLKNLPVDGEDDGSSGASVVAIDNKIEQAMDLVKSHLMYAVREEVEVLKEQIKELIERNSQLEQENNLLKTLASPEQLAQFQAQVQSGSPSAPTQPPGTGAQQSTPPTQPAPQSSGPSA